MNPDQTLFNLKKSRLKISPDLALSPVTSLTTDPQLNRQMEITPPTTMNELEHLDTNVFAYKLLQDPAPGKVVYHSAVTQYIMYGLGTHTLDSMVAGTSAEDVAKHIMATYNHPNRTFEIHAPGLVNIKAPQNLNFT